jgi:casein kinase 1
MLFTLSARCAQDPFIFFYSFTHILFLLSTSWWQCTCGAGGLSAITVLRIANDMLERLHDMSKMNIVHRDIQPANILMGRLNGKSRDTPHLIDFGIAISGTCASDESQINTPPQHAFSGTPRFSSVSALSKHGGGSTPVDDLESLCYTLAFLRTGRMPWPEQAEDDAMSSSKGALALAKLKGNTKFKLICGNEFVDDPAAKGIGLLLAYARLCSSSDDDGQMELPDYSKCQTIVRDILDAKFDAKERMVPPDWEIGMITWSTEDGVLQNTLYN